MEKFQTGRLIVSSTDKSADLLYAGGFDAPDEFVYFEAGNVRAIVVSILELARAMKEARKDIQVINRYDIYKILTDEERQHVNFYGALSRYAGVKCWLVPSDFPLSCALQLQEAGVQVQCVQGEFFPERRVKRPDELEAIRQSMHATQNAMELVHDMIAESTVNSHGILELHGKVLTCDDIRSEVEVQFKRQQFSACRTIIACGKDAAAPHNIGSGPVYAHQPVVADIFPRSDVTGYWGDMTRTFCKGSASPVVRRAFDAVKKASETALAHLKAGVPGILLHQLAAKTMEEAGFPTGKDAEGKPCGFIHTLGHGVGLEIHEFPRVSTANLQPLQENNVISIEPGLYHSSWGGIRLEDLVAVKADGYENFCTMPKELEIP